MDIMEPWCPWATRDVVFNDAGPYTGGPFRGVLHTTEGSSYAGARAAYAASGNGPHFTVAADSVHQHVALDRASTALMHPTGTIDTNKLSAVQIEIVGFAAHPEALPLENVRRLMVWIEGQTGIKPIAPKFLAYPASAGNSAVRFSGVMWKNFGGWCGHEHVPFNDHGDPGAIDIASLLVRGVAPMYSPPLQVVADLKAPTGGAWGLGPDGAIYGFGGAPYYGGANGQPYFAGRTAARLEARADGGYDIIDTAGERYQYPAK